MRYGHLESSLRGFSWQRGLSHFAQKRARTRLSGLTDARICLSIPPTGLNPHFQPRAGLSFCVTPSLKRSQGGTGILTRCPSPTPFGLGLGPTNPGRISLPQETLGFRREGFSPSLSLLVPAVALPLPSTGPHGPASPGWNAPLPPPARRQKVRSFGTELSPVTLSARNRSTSELLRFL